MSRTSPLSSLEEKVLPKLLEGMSPQLIGKAVQLSDPNVRVAIARLKLRYDVLTIDEVLTRAQSEFGAK